MNALTTNLTPVEVRLEDLFLDPNIPRFVGSEWTYVPDDEAVETAAQTRATRRLIENHEVDKLRQIMEANGFLPIDRVVVRAVADGKYIVLEGNRRICAK